MIVQRGEQAFRRRAERHLDQAPPFAPPPRPPILFDATPLPWPEGLAPTVRFEAARIGVTVGIAVQRRGADPLQRGLRYEQQADGHRDAEHEADADVADDLLAPGLADRLRAARDRHRKFGSWCGGQTA